MHDLEFDWFFSDFQAGALLDAVTGEQLSTQLLATTFSGQFSFLELEDNQTSWGGNLSLPSVPRR